MSYGTLASDVIQSSTTGTPTQFNDGSGTQIGTLCRAWVNYNGNTTTKNGSFNVSSVTRNSTGNYTINFTNAFPDTNYAASVSTAPSSTSAVVVICELNGRSTTSVGFYVSASGTNVDSIISVAIFR